MGTKSERIRSDLTTAMKARDAERTGTLRLIVAALQNERIAKGSDLDEDEVNAVLSRAAKQRIESIEHFEKAGRQELADKEHREHEIISEYLPEQLDDSEIERIVKETIASLGAETRKDMGRVMGTIMGQFKGQIDGKKVQAVAGKLLA